jgi:hypothetical protein
MVAVVVSVDIPQEQQVAPWAAAVKVAAAVRARGLREAVALVEVVMVAAAEAAEGWVEVESAVEA